MRVVTDTITGTGSNEITVARGALGTGISTHDSGSLLNKVDPIAIEFRRPSIIRASGHTFEYLGYGPGNYSTGLPQVQDRTLTETEEFLSQAQERRGGIVVYTGMNNKLKELVLTTTIFQRKFRVFLQIIQKYSHIYFQILERI